MSIQKQGGNPMKNLIVNWCKVMFTQTNGSIRVRTASCQNGVLSAIRQGTPANDIEVISSINIAGQTPILRIEENTVYLNRTESSFVQKEVRRMLKTQAARTRRQKQAGIPLPPQPGKIAYAVYQ